MHQRTHAALLLTGLTLGLVACTGETTTTTGGTVAGLSGPGQVSVVAADTSGLATGGNSAPGSVTPGANVFAPDSDYATDEANAFIYDPSMESLGTVNSILCQTSMTSYGKMVNQGDYLAQIDVDLCEKGGNSGASGTGQSSGGSSLEIFTVNSTRASSTAEQLVRFWVPLGDGPGGTKSIIRAQMDIAGAATLDNPYGKMTLNFAAPDALGDYTNPSMFGRIATADSIPGQIGFDFFESMGDTTVPHAPGEFSRTTAVSVSMTSDQADGAARVRVTERSNFGADSGEQTTEWKLAFNGTHVKRQLDGGAITTLSRTNFDSKVWSYNLYYNTGPNAGQRVALNSGFGFRTAGDVYGWIGYHGMWVPEGTALASGDTVFRDIWGEDTATPYTLLRAPGKLIRNSKNTMDLVDLAGQSFSWYDPMASTNFRVDYSAGSWWKNATWDENSFTWTDLVSPILLDVVADAGGWLNMWSDSLGGQVSYVDGSSFITYYQRVAVNGADPIFSGGNTRIALYGYFDCLKAQMSGAEVEAGSIYLPNSNDVNTPHVYRFDATDLTLYYDADGTDSSPLSAGLAAGQEPTTGQYMWGMNSGPLVLDTSGILDTSELWDQTEFYTYETGHNDWNKYAAVIDSNGDMVEFDAPLQFLYTHAQANDINDDATFAGQNFYLEYGGAGNLGGIPSAGTDIDGDGNPDRWYPLFSLKDGVEVGPTGTEYTLRPIEMEQSLQPDPGGAPGLDIADADGLTLPDGSSYQTPLIGAQPVITDPPAVISGEVQ